MRTLRVRPIGLSTHAAQFLCAAVHRRSGPAPFAGGGESDTDGNDTAESQGEPSTGADTQESDGQTGSSGDGDNVDETSDGEQCEQSEVSFTFTPQTPNVMLVLDKSRSMSNLWDHDLNPGTPEISRYHSLHNVVNFLVSEFSNDINFGAQLFPSAAAYLDEPTNDFSCLVVDPPEVSIGSNTAANILSVMPPADDFTFSGGTPAVAGQVSAIDHLNAEAPQGNRAVIFITDGAANCSPDESTSPTPSSRSSRTSSAPSISTWSRSSPTTSASP